MLERITESIKPVPPEIPTGKIIDTLALTITTLLPDGIKSELSSDSRDKLLAAGILHNSGLAESIAFITKQDGINPTRKYLAGLDIPPGDIFSYVIPDSQNETQRLEQIVKENKLGDVATVTIGNLDKEAENQLKLAGIETETLSPEEEIGRRIVESSKKSRKLYVEALKTVFLKMIRIKNIPNIQITRLKLINV
jgi:hypothetical protein